MASSSSSSLAAGSNRKDDYDVLVCGGHGDDDDFLDSCELYNSRTNTWRAVARMATKRINAHAVRLADECVLVTGGRDKERDYFTTFETYDPKEDKWSNVVADMTTNMNRHSHSATTMLDGRGFLAGGKVHWQPRGQVTGSCGIYDPRNGTCQWMECAELPIARSRHSASLLLDGRVLIVGGQDQVYGTLNSCVIFDPKTKKWSNAPNLIRPRYNHASATLLDGRVIVVGGNDGKRKASCELFDPKTNSWSDNVAELETAREGHSASILANGRVLVAGGYHYKEDCKLNSCELYDPATNTWENAAPMTNRRTCHAASTIAKLRDEDEDVDVETLFGDVKNADKTKQ